MSMTLQRIRRPRWNLKCLKPATDLINERDVNIWTKIKSLCIVHVSLKCYCASKKTEKIKVLTVY